MRKNKLTFFRSVIYSLKRDYGFRLDLYRPVEVTNFQTGKKTVTRVKYKIRRAILLPNSIFRDFAYASLFRTVQNVQFGGVVDVKQRTVIVDKRELPLNFRINSTDYLVFNHNRYEIKNIVEMELSDYWQLIIRQVDGDIASEIHEQRLKDKLVFTEQWLINS